MFHVKHRRALVEALVRVVTGTGPGTLPVAQTSEQRALRTRLMDGATRSVHPVGERVAEIKIKIKGSGAFGWARS